MGILGFPFYEKSRRALFVLTLLGALVGAIFQAFLATMPS